MDHKNPVESGRLARALRVSAIVAVPLLSSIFASCASTVPKLLHQENSVVASQVTAKTSKSNVMQTQYLDSAINELCRLDSLVQADVPSAQWGSHGVDLRQIKEKNADNRIFLAALDDFIRMIYEAPDGLPGYTACTNVKNSSVLMMDSTKDPTRKLTISPLRPAGARFEIINYGTGACKSFSITKHTGADEFFRFGAAMCDFANTAFSPWSLSNSVTR